MGVECVMEVSGGRTVGFCTHQLALEVGAEAAVPRVFREGALRVAAESNGNADDVVLSRCQQQQTVDVVEEKRIGARRKLNKYPARAP